MTPTDIAFQYGDRRIFELLDSVAKGHGIPISDQGEKELIWTKLKRNLTKTELNLNLNI